MLAGPYRLHDAEIQRRVVLTNKVPTGAYRGYGQAESNYVREVLVDRLARRLGRDPADFRRQNLLRPDELPYKNVSGVTYDSGDYARGLDLAVSRVGYETFRTRQKDLRQQGRHVGVGMSCYVEFTGYPSSAFLGRAGAKFGAYESVTLRMDRAGRAAISTGVSTFGQGTETTFRADGRLAARARSGRRRDSPRRLAGHAVQRRRLREPHDDRRRRRHREGRGADRDKMLRIAGTILGVDPAALEVAAGVIRRRDDPSAQISIQRVSEAAFLGHPLPPGEDPGLEATAYFDPPSSAFGYGTVVVQVEVDARSGEFALQRYILVHDCGTQVNPMIVEGQVQGAVAQGIAAALFEELVYDRDTGSSSTGRWSTISCRRRPTCRPSSWTTWRRRRPVTPFGIKGVGEGWHHRGRCRHHQCRLRRAGAVRRGAGPAARHGESIWRALAEARAKG
jgi:carbon-monoxide dehydrogenase large subunit